MIRTASSRLAAGAGLLSLAMTAPICAHVDDPKEQDRLPRYEGVGYRADVDKGMMPMTFPYDGITLLAWLPLPEFGPLFGRANDCWGYTSASGREYAIIGLDGGTGFVEVTNPGNPQIIDVVSGPVSTWRDIKVYQDHAYAVTEGFGSAIQVFDLSDLDAGVVTVAGTINSGGETDTHNVVIDTDSGMLYRTGGADTFGGAGLRIYSLENPASPAFVGEWSERYVHDAQVVTWTTGALAGRQIAFCCSGFNGGWVETGLDILDVTDPQNIVPIARYLYPNGQYSHQGWLSADRQYFFLDDELDEQNTGVPTKSHVIDISNLAAPFEAATFSSGSTAIDHNMYVDGHLIFQANYRSGLRVFDASDPLAPVEIGYFDTFPADDAPAFNGLWSNFPYFDSGTVIGSDIEKGLFVWRLGDPALQFSFPAGLPELISPLGDTVPVEITELEAGDLMPGSATLHVAVGGADFSAVPMSPAGGTLFEATFPVSACPETVRYFFSAQDADGLPLTSPLGAPYFAYDATVASDVITVLSNDMETAAGWTVASEDLTDGEWERGVPVGDGSRGDPVSDYDGSGQCWLTDNAAGNSDVDGGPTRLTTAALDLSGLDDPYLSYARWFANDDNDIDRLDTEISDDDGASWVLVDSSGSTQGWELHLFRIADYVTPTSQVRLRFSATDNPNDSVTEAAIDALSVVTFVCDTDLPGDLTGPGGAPDGVVDALDFLLLVSQWGSPCTGSCEADITGPGGAPDGNVDALDYLLLLANWTQP